MGQPSLSIYVNELIREYGAQQLVRVGSCGALSDTLASATSCSRSVPRATRR